jgi:hypothetical protein
MRAFEASRSLTVSEYQVFPQGRWLLPVTPPRRLVPGLLSDSRLRIRTFQVKLV